MSSPSASNISAGKADVNVQVGNFLPCGCGIYITGDAKDRLISGTRITMGGIGMIAQYKCVFSVNGQRITQMVMANSTMEAKKIVELQYRGLRLTWWDCRKM